MSDPFRLAIDTIPGLVWSSLPDGHIDFLNQRWLEYTGLPLERAIGRGWQAAVFPDDLPGLLEIWRKVLASGAPGETEARLRRHDGVYRWFLFRAMPLHDSAGTLVKWYGQTTDIEDRKWAEAMLSGEKRLLEMIAKGNTLVVDVRDGTEVAASGKVAGAVHVSRGLLEFRADPELPSHDKNFAKDKDVILYCGSGGRAALAGKLLKDLGYEKVYNLGGFKDWADSGGAVDKA